MSEFSTSLTAELLLILNRRTPKEELASWDEVHHSIAKKIKEVKAREKAEQEAGLTKEQWAERSKHLQELELKEEGEIKIWQESKTKTSS